MPYDTKLSRASQGELRDAGFVVERGPSRSAQKNRGRFVQLVENLPVAFEYGIRFGRFRTGVVPIKIALEALSRTRNNRIIEAIQPVLDFAGAVATGEIRQLVRVSDLPIEVLPPTFVADA